MAPYLRQVLPGPEDLAIRAAELFVMAASSAISARGSFSVAFSGGSTPELFFRSLSVPPFDEGVQWEKVHVFFVDERCVPPDHELSNFRLASEALLSKARAIVHRIYGELGPGEAAKKYASELEDVLGRSPQFDMIFLGMGDDGHTASLFPGSGSLMEEDRLAVAVEDREPPRVTLTLPVINAARTIIFLVTGASKAAKVRQILGEDMHEGGSGPAPGERGDSVPPAGMVNEKALWLLDEEAASGLMR